MSGRPFVHLHCHADGSPLDGLALVTDLIPAAERLGMPAIALTDHGSMAAAYDLHKAAKGTSVKPIFGCLLRGQEIITDAGMAPVEAIREGDRVLTHKGRFRRVVRTMHRAYRGNGYEVRLAGIPRTLTLTEEHPILVCTADGEHVWEQPGDIRDGRLPGGDWASFACLPRLPAGEPGTGAVTMDLAYLLGAYAARGTALPDGGVELLLPNEAAGRADAAAGIVTPRDDGWLAVGVPAGPDAALLARLVGEEDAARRVPAEVLAGPRELRSAFADGFLAGQRRIQVRSGVLAWGVRAVLADGGRWASVEAGAAGFVVTLPDDFGDAGIDDEYVYWPIQTITSVDIDAQVFNFAVDEDNSYVSDFVLHNCEAYLAPDVPREHRAPVRWSNGGEDDVAGGGAYTHMTMLAETDEGLANLFAISSESYLSGLYRKPRCLLPGQLIVTARGRAPIEDVRVGDLVLTHEGRFRPVTHVMSSVHDGVAYGIRAAGHTTWLTGEHPVLASDAGQPFEWVEASRVRAEGPGARASLVCVPSSVRDGGSSAFDAVPVESVEVRGYAGVVHNLEVADDHSYVSGFAVHNCDVELLQRRNGGIIATTGCPSGEVQTLLRIGDYARARDSAAKFRDIFGAGNFYVELMDHGLQIEQRVIKDLIRLAGDLGLPMVATNDLHYVSKDDARVHEALLCVSSGSKLHDPKRFKFDADDFYLKSAAEMRAIWDAEVPEACDNTLVIAERCNAAFTTGKNLMPRFPIPDGHTEDSWFRHEVTEGMRRRYPNGVPDDRAAQAEHEIAVITQMGFPGYFLIVADFIGWAKRQGIWVGPGRGSAAGSIVAYALGITELDPISNGLIFERFLNPERVSPPDIDIDFDEKRRGEVIEYVRRKYGEDKIAHIGTFMTVKAKAAIKDAARVLDLPYALGDRLNKAYPPAVAGRDLSLRGAYDPENDRYSEAAEFRRLAAADPDAAKVVALAKGLEGVKRGHGMHAAGIIMSSEPIIDHVPLMKRDADAPVMTQFEYPACEAIGLAKMDFLGLSNLTTIGEALRMIQQNRGVDVKLRDVWADMSDTRTFEMLAAGETLGVFQLDSGPIRSLLRLMQPDRFNDISAVLALYRPGPMGAGSHTEYADRKNGRKPITPIHPEFAEAFEPILGETYGLCLTGDTLIWDAGSGQRVRLDAIAGQVASGGFSTFGLNPDGTVSAHRVTRWKDHGVQHVVRVTTSDGNSIVMTDDHRMLTPAGYVHARDLVPGQHQLAIPATPFEPAAGQRGGLGKGHARDLGERAQQAAATGAADAGACSIARVLSGPNAGIRAYLDGWRAAAGQVGQASAFGPASAAVARDLKDLLARLNVPARLLANLPGGGSHAVQPSGPSQEEQPGAPGCAWVDIVSVEDAGYQRTYDITVEDVHNFLANGLVSSNCIYQEQVMEIARAVAGYSLGQADLLRRAMGKKSKAILDREFEPFLAAATANGYSEPAIRALWDVLVPFSDYAFNRCVVGATGVRLGQASGGGEIPIALLHSLLHGPRDQHPDGACAHCVRPSRGQPECPACLAWGSLVRAGQLTARAAGLDGRVYDAPVKAVYHNGTRRVHAVTTADGTRIVATANHRHLTERGWVEVRDLVPGDMLAVAGGPGMPERVSYSAVVSIADAGEQEVYDLEMDDPSHSWVGNGVVTHNSHSAAYGYVSYATAWLKANFPVEYMSALLSTNADDKDKSALYLNECRKMGLPVLAPDVNESDADYAAVGDSIRVGLVAVKNVGRKAIDAILASRRESGQFASFEDFLTSCPPEALNKRAVESLIKAGAFDSFGHSRNALALIHADAVDAAASVAKARQAGQVSLFAGAEDDPGLGIVIPDVPEWDRMTRMRLEREMLGLYVTDHPLRGLEAGLRREAPMSIPDVTASMLASGADVRIAGLIAAVERRTTKKGDSWASMTVEDLGGSVVVNVFPRAYADAAEHMNPDAVVAVDGKVERREDGSVAITANRVSPLDMRALDDPESVPFVLAVDESRLTQQVMEQLRDALRTSPGRTPVRMRVRRADGSEVTLELDARHSVRRSPALTSEVKAVLGIDAVA